MVSNQGFNALLKIVEEPPPHIKFIFATTEPDKVIGTIRSRTHHYPFRLVPPDVLVPYLQQLCDQRGRARGLRRAAARGARGRRVGPRHPLGARPADRRLRRGRARVRGRCRPARVHPGLAARRPGRGDRRPRRCLGVPGGRPRDLDRATNRGGSSRTCSSGCATSSSSPRPATPPTPPCATSPPTSSTACACRPATWAPPSCRGRPTSCNAALTEMTGATSPRLHLELLMARLLLPAAEDTRSGVRRASRPARARAARRRRRGGARRRVAGPPARRGRHRAHRRHRLPRRRSQPRLQRRRSPRRRACARTRRPSPLSSARSPRHRRRSRERRRAGRSARVEHR